MIKTKKKIWDFFRPTKGKIIIFVVFIILLLSLTIFIGRVSCLYREPCDDGTFGYFKTYLHCGTCIEPTLKEDIIGYTKYYLFHPFNIISEFDLVDKIGLLIGVLAFIFDIVVLYSIICFYIRLKKTLSQSVKDKK